MKLYFSVASTNVWSQTPVIRSMTSNRNFCEKRSVNKHFRYLGQHGTTAVLLCCRPKIQLDRAAP